LYWPLIELPDTDPVYVIAWDPTVPKWIRPLATVPVIVTARGAVERSIVPVSFDVDCAHRRTKVPVYAPPHLPFQLPDSTGPATGANDLVGLVGVATLARGADVTPAAGDVDDEADSAAVEDVKDVVLLDEHAATSAADVPSTRIRFVRFMFIAPKTERLAVAEYEATRNTSVRPAGRVTFSGRAARRRNPNEPTGGHLDESVELASAADRGSESALAQWNDRRRPAHRSRRQARSRAQQLPAHHSWWSTAFGRMHTV
jgi:hypothetical protein